MDADKETWYLDRDFDEKIKKNVVIPENVMEMTDYYNKLQQQAADLEQHDYESLEENMTEAKATRQRNAY